MGPFELLDLVGGDVAHAVMVSIYNQYFNEPMYQPSAQMAVRVAGGLLGRKSKQGFYDYSGPPSAGEPTVTVAPQPMPAAAWICDEDGGAELAEWLKGAGVKAQLGGTPAASVLCFVTPLGEDASNAAVRLKLDPVRTVAVDMLGRFQGRRTLMKTPLTAPEMLGAAYTALSAGNVPVTVINDSPGFVIQRLLCMIVNIGSRIAELRIAAPADIDTAVELGLNYPKGPLALGDMLGGARVLGGARRHAFRHARSEISRHRLAAPPRAARHFVAVARLRVRAGGPEPCRSMPKPWFSCATPCGASCASG